MMTGLFIGIIDTVVSLGFNIGYRSFFSGYVPSDLINVSSLIFGVNLLLLVIGMIYYLFTKVFGKWDIVFSIVFLLITLYLIWQISLGHRFSDPAENREFKGLLMGIVLIIGLSVSTLPNLFHSKFLDKYVL